MSMKSITFYSYVGADGLLDLKVPVGIANADVQVVVVIGTWTTKKSPEDLGWRPGFFEETAGAWQGEPLAREPQGDYEPRKELG